MSAALSYRLTLRLFREEKSFGPGPMNLLNGVRRTGSLHQAAADMGMAYSKAWKMIRSLEADWGFVLLIRRSGGVSGGGSVLTEEAEDLLMRYESMLSEVEQAADAAMKKYFP